MASITSSIGKIGTGIQKIVASNLMEDAAEKGWTYAEFMTKAAMKGVVKNPNVIAYAEVLKERETPPKSEQIRELGLQPTSATIGGVKYEAPPEEDIGLGAAGTAQLAQDLTSPRPAREVVQQEVPGTLGSSGSFFGEVDPTQPPTPPVERTPSELQTQLIAGGGDPDVAKQLTGAQSAEDREARMMKNAENTSDRIALDERRFANLRRSKDIDDLQKFVGEVDVQQLVKDMSELPSAIAAKEAFLRNNPDLNPEARARNNATLKDWKDSLKNAEKQYEDYIIAQQKLKRNLGINGGGGGSAPVVGQNPQREEAIAVLQKEGVKNPNEAQITRVMQALQGDE